MVAAHRDTNPALPPVVSQEGVQGSCNRTLTRGSSARFGRIVISLKGPVDEFPLDIRFSDEKFDARNA